MAAEYHPWDYDADLFCGLSFNISIPLVLTLSPPNIQPWPNTGVGGRKSTWPTGSPPHRPPPTTTQGLLAGLLRLGTDFFGARLSSMATL